ncbi:MAG: M48 family metallopeptidase [Gemmatimonadota bacterium]|nr:M48 family metallopeptidase [Gemmatimonadota bacterium]MDH5195953.1 M48 family metallopeptidase [Gemmatimonadota bacterium]
MTEATGTPETPQRRVLTQIAPDAWEHAADRAALNALRQVPGFDEAVKRIFGFFGERGIRLLFQANAVRCGPKQFAKLHDMLIEACATMDWPDHPELYVTQTPLVNAGAVGFEHPFIVLNSGAVSLLDDDELHVLIGHELGHVISGHALYRTITILLLELGFQNLPFLAGIALLPIKLALLEWYRKSELSADRAGLLASQDLQASQRVFLKLAGGGDMAQMDLDTFLEQAKEYELSGGPLDTIYKILNTLGASHPFNTLRAAELQRWVDGGAYEKIIGGEYPRRGDVRNERSYSDDVSDAASHYAREARDVAADVVDAAKRAASAFASAFKENREK